MPNRFAKKLEKIQHVLEALAEESARKTPIVVEGKKDVEALRELGVTGPIICLKTGGKSLDDALRLIEQTGCSEVILLVDFDRSGKEAMSFLKRNLERAHVVPNTAFWQSLSALLSRDVQCVESLSAYVETLKQKTL